jgi:hydroxymethylpyrimidine pyrophosphatase-like HAD family hydrolase
MSIDGTPISRTDLARIAAEEALHAEQQRNAVRVVAASARDAQDCRTLLAMLGLTDDIVAAARAQPPTKPKPGCAAA